MLSVNMYTIAIAMYPFSEDDAQHVLYNEHILSMIVIMLLNRGTLKTKLIKCQFILLYHFNCQLLSYD